MNVFVQPLAEQSVDSAPDLRSTDLVVEDNVGEGIHVHFRNVRLEMSIDDFETFADAVDEAEATLDGEGR